MNAILYLYEPPPIFSLEEKRGSLYLCKQENAFAPSAFCFLPSPFSTPYLAPRTSHITAYDNYINETSYTVQAACAPGGINSNWNTGQFFLSMAQGAVSGAISSGIGTVFGQVGAMGASGELMRAIAHGAANVVVKAVFRQDISISTFASGFVSSIAGSAMHHTPVWAQIGASALMGGATSKISGGNFWEGFVTGAIVAGLNHAADAGGKPTIVNKDSKNVYYKPEDGEYGEWNVVLPGGRHYEPIDGVATSKYKDMVFKVPDGGRVSVLEGGDVEFSSSFNIGGKEWKNAQYFIDKGAYHTTKDVLVGTYYSKMLVKLNKQSNENLEIYILYFRNYSVVLYNIINDILLSCKENIRIFSPILFSRP